jgi:hypothetical protein
MLRHEKKNFSKIEVSKESSYDIKKSKIAGFVSRSLQSLSDLFTKKKDKDEDYSPHLKTVQKHKEEIIIHELGIGYLIFVGDDIHKQKSMFHDWSLPIQKIFKAKAHEVPKESIICTEEIVDETQFNNVSDAMEPIIKIPDISNINEVNPKQPPMTRESYLTGLMNGSNKLSKSFNSNYILGDLLGDGAFGIYFYNSGFVLTAKRICDNTEVSFKYHNRWPLSLLKKKRFRLIAS